MLADEEGILKNLPMNMIGSYLYESDIHGTPIVGDILFAAEHLTDDGIDLCGIQEPACRKLVEQLNVLKNKLRKLMKKR